MNAQGLLARYARIADAPDAIARLRWFVLNLAVRGKLVEQDAGEESAVQLLAKINQAKEARISSGDIRKPRELVKDDTVDQPFTVPATWKWIRLDEVGAIVGGGTPSASDPENFAEPGQGVPWLTPADLGGFKGLYVSTGSRDLSERGVWSSSATVMPQGTVLFTSRAPIGYVAITANALATNQGFKSVVPYVEECSRFIALVLKTFAPEIDAKAPGTTFKEVSGKIVAGIAFPLAPLAEQQRIVAKVDELMALCDQLEVARAQREAARDRLAAASLARLNATGSDTFPADARFALDALPALTTRPDQIKQLRQTILNLAVRGKLSPEGGWQQAPKSVGSVASLQNGYAFKSEWFASKGVRLLRNINIGHGAIDWTKGTYLSEQRVHDYVRFRLNLGDVVLSLDRPFIATGTKVARVKNADLPALLLQRVGRFVLSHEITPDYLYVWINSPHFSEQIDPGRSNGVPHISSKQVEAASLFLPPLEEQHRIVAKVDELMALCDQLEASLTTGETTRSRLLDALLHEALAAAPAASSEHPRAGVSGYVVSRLAFKRNFGRTAHMKHLYLAESRLGLKLGGRYKREAAGPFDTGIYELEKQAEAAGWYTHRVETLPSGNEKVSYVPGNALKALAEEGVAVLGASREEMDRLIDLMGGLKTEQVEIIATLFAAWNDALLDGQTPDDDWIVKEVRENWHVSKQRFKPAELHKWLGWMRQNDVIPLGHPPRTMQQTAMEL